MCIRPILWNKATKEDTDVTLETFERLIGCNAGSRVLRDSSYHTVLNTALSYDLLKLIGNENVLVILALLYRPWSSPPQVRRGSQLRSAP